jgi:hypothetical protein
MLQLPQRGDDDEYGHRACAQGEVWRRFQGNPSGVRRGPPAAETTSEISEQTPPL